MANLFDLIRLAPVSPGLQIQYFPDPFGREDVMAPTDGLLKTDPPKELSHAREGNIRIGVATQNLLESLPRARDGRFVQWRG